MSNDLHIVGFRVGKETFGVPITACTKLCACRRSPLFPTPLTLWKA